MQSSSPNFTCICKMARVLLWYLLAASAVLTLCAKTGGDPRKDEKTAVAPASKMEKDVQERVPVVSRDDYDLMGAMNNCNDSFRIEMSYLEALNESGSFPDETDKTPKCYLRCVLESLEIASPEGDFDAERTAEIFAGERNGTPMDGIEEIATLCAERSETCKCERSYNYLKCVFSMEIERYENNS